jgi:hypothetical protein
MVMIEYIWLHGVERFQFEVSVIPIVVTRPVYNILTDFLWTCTEQGADVSLGMSNEDLFM